MRRPTDGSPRVERPSIERERRWREGAEGSAVLSTDWTLEERVAFLARIPLFERLPPAAQARIAATLRTRRVGRGEFAFMEGESADTLDVLAEGVIKVVRETEAGTQVILRFITPGEIFGGAGAWSEPCYPASALAQEPCLLLQLPASDFSEMIATEPDFALAVVRELGLRLREAEARIRALQTETVERRVARILLRLAHKTGIPSEAGLRVGIPLTRQDVADLSGSTLFTSSRILSAWTQAGIISSDRARITLRRPDALAALLEEPGLR